MCAKSGVSVVAASRCLKCCVSKNVKGSNEQNGCWSYLETPKNVYYSHIPPYPDPWILISFLDHFSEFKTL